MGMSGGTGRPLRPLPHKPRAAGTCSLALAGALLFVSSVRSGFILLERDYRGRDRR